MKSLFLSLFLITAFIFNSGCSSDAKKEDKALLASSNKNTDKNMVIPKTKAPEINTKYGWVNTEKDYSLSDFKGKIVLLDFWTFGCINCQHIIPDLEKLEKEFENELVVVGVHSAKFSAEKATQKIRQAVLKFGIHHPVVNDADMKVWRSYAIRAWPTVVIIDPEGKVVWQRAGERFYDQARAQILRLKEEYAENLNTEKLDFQLTKMDDKTLMFPSKMILTADKKAIWIADSGNNRVLKINLNGKVLEVIGSGEKGMQNGDFEEATFYEPHGLALKDDKLYIADTKNNAIRKAHLTSKKVETLSGDGSKEYYRRDKKWDEPVKPNSPWDLLIDEKYPNQMYIAGAGNHQILRFDFETEQTMRFAGSGREQLTDGDDLKQVAFNQPSGLTQHENLLFVADSEASAIRQIDLKAGTVKTLVGSGLFDFGDKDGTARNAVLQHPVGVFYRDNKVYIADTYNGKIKVLDLESNRVKTLVSGLNEPNDLLFLEGKPYVSDTNNHQILRIDTKTFEKEVLEVIMP